MTLDSRLNWEKHVDRVKAKARSTLNIIEVVVGKKWEKDKKLYYGYQIYSTAFTENVLALSNITSRSKCS